MALALRTKEIADGRWEKVMDICMGNNDYSSVDINELEDAPVRSISDQPRKVEDVWRHTSTLLVTLGRYVFNFFSEQMMNEDHKVGHAHFRKLFLDASKRGRRKK